MFKKIIYLLPLAIISTACSDENDEPGSSYELRTLTFEDTDAKFSPYSFADRSDITIADWSDLMYNTTAYCSTTTTIPQTTHGPTAAIPN